MISPPHSVESKIERRRIHVEGIVQGVGFRPFVFNLAERYGLAGWVLNNATGVVIEVEGDEQSLNAFTCAIEIDAPPLARIVHVASDTIPSISEIAFRIEKSHSEDEKRAWISPDASICDDCLRELFDPNDRRYRYPFINCTNCGPRFTIIRDVPYDRPFTTMSVFAMCADCRGEYDDPHDRRFHAQPNACPKCGPSMRLITESECSPPKGDEAIHAVGRLLAQGMIIAVKGLGGYHLACDAQNEQAVLHLRERKRRWHKPFALMVPHVETARALCMIDDDEEDLLVSRQRPIVLLRVRERELLASEVAPKQNYLGVMLPYTPLHTLLLDEFQRALGEDRPAALVMTSGNVSDEPIAYQDNDARERLASIADGFLVHARDIHMRCDDSVLHVIAHQPVSIRRSRGYAPEPIRAPIEFHEPMLAVGAHLKNTFCLGKGRYAFVSQHIGDLENYETYRSFTGGIEHFKRLFDIEPRIVAYDLHPEYLATKYALDLPDDIVKIGVQHHHAHIVSVMGEHALEGPVIGVAFDGTGYGTDGTIWGGEFLIANYKEFERLAHLDTIPLLGGEQAIHDVWRLAAAWLDQVYGDEFLDLNIDFVRGLDRAKWRVLKQMSVQNLNSPRSSAMGRLFDAVSALIGVCHVARYEAQAAIELEMIADETCEAVYPFDVTNATPHILRLDATIRAIVDDIQRGVRPAMVAAKFHHTIAEATMHICTQIRRERGVSQIVLGGGVFQNALLLKRVFTRLNAADFSVFVSRKLPPNDGGLSFGQAIIANAERS